MPQLLAAMFWLCVLGVMIPYTLYPAFLWLLSRFRRTEPADGPLVPVTFVISAYNEAEVIAEKLENTLELEYPKDKLQILVISDESEDETDGIVRGFPEVELCRQAPREGKSAGITRFANRFEGEIVVFSDANSMYRRDALRHLVKPFGNARVGYVVGQQRYVPAAGAAPESENVYWNHELRLKSWEGRLSSVVGGDGAIMAIRRALFQPLRADDINDFVLPLKIVLAGYRGVFAPEAVCYEQAAPSLAGEFHRKVRIVNRSFRAILRTPAALNPFRVGVFAWQLACHKVIRWFAGYFMFGALLLNSLLAMQGDPLYQSVMLLQVVFYGMAFFGPQLPSRLFKPARLCYYFCLANGAAALGVFKVLTGKRYITWTPQRGTT